MKCARIMEKIGQVFMFTLFLCTYDNSLADNTAPPKIRDAITVPATLNTDPTLQIHIGLFTVKFEETSLNEIKNTIGPGVIRHSGDAGKSQYWLCYSTPGVRIWFISHGEMGGLEHALTRVIAVSESSTSQRDSDCPLMPDKFHSISFPFGWIGTTKKALLEALGPPSGTANGSLKYFYERPILDKDHGNTIIGYVDGYVDMRLLNSRVTMLDAGHITSY